MKVTNKDELIKIILDKEILLDTIDVSKIRDMRKLFIDIKEINGSISGWDVSNVINMEAMFYNSKFNPDISNWNVSKVTNMSCMFYNTNFDKDISKWNTSSVKNMGMMFAYAPFNQDVSKWDISNVTNIAAIFQKSSIIKQNLGAWDISGKDGIFIGSSYTLEHYQKDREEYLNIIENEKYIKEVESIIKNDLNKNINLDTLEMEF